MPKKDIGKEKTIARYVAAPDRLEAALAGLSEANLDVSRQEGKWTIRQIVHHIIDGDDISKTIVKVALGNTGCTYDQTWYDTSNLFAETLDYKGREITPALALFRANRTHVVQLLRHFPDSWERFVILKWQLEPDGQKVTIGELIYGQTYHALHHIKQIRATREVHGL